MQSKTYHQTDELTSDMARFWTPERNKILRRLLARKLPYSEIAREIGAVSKDSICGQVARLGLSKPRTVKRRYPRDRAAPRKPGEINPVGRPPHTPSQIVQLDEHPNRQKLLDPRVNAVRKCRWIEGHPAGVQTVFCSDTALTGASYCARHYAQCVTARVSLQLPKAA